MKDLCDRLLGEIKAEAHAKRVPIAKAMNVFMQSYNTHKNYHGSLKDLPQEHYQAAMNDRYKFMYSETMVYIQEEHQKYLDKHKRDI